MFSGSNVGVNLSGCTKGARNRVLTPRIVLQYFAAGLHHVDAPECDGCCHGRNGTLIQGSPKTGDGWSFTFADGSVATVCKAGSVQGGMAVCDGKANIRPAPPQNRAVALAARALNGTGQPRVILSLR